VIRERSESEPAARRRLRSLAIFSFRVRRRRISGRRLGADNLCSSSELNHQLKTPAAGRVKRHPFIRSVCSDPLLRTAKLNRRVSPSERRIKGGHKKFGLASSQPKSRTNLHPPAISARDPYPRSPGEEHLGRVRCPDDRRWGGVHRSRDSPSGYPAALHCCAPDHG
jgi:hypothetical protein